MPLSLAEQSPAVARACVIEWSLATKPKPPHPSSRYGAGSRGRRMLPGSSLIINSGGGVVTDMGRIRGRHIQARSEIHQHPHSHFAGCRRVRRRKDRINFEGPKTKSVYSARQWPSSSPHAFSVRCRARNSFSLRRNAQTRATRLRRGRRHAPRFPIESAIGQGTAQCSKSVAVSNAGGGQPPRLRLQQCFNV